MTCPVGEDMTQTEIKIPVNKIEVLNTKLRNPCATLQQIGDKYGLSRERIRQILEPYNLPAGRSIRGLYSRTCPSCGGEKNEGAKICSKCLRRNGYARLIPIACEVCGKIVYRSEKNVIWKIKNKKQEHFWCSNKCKGRWLGNNYHPQPKYDWDKVIGLYRDNYTAKEIEQMTGTPMQTIYTMIPYFRKKGIIINHINRGSTKVKVNA